MSISAQGQILKGLKAPQLTSARKIGTYSKNYVPNVRL